MKADNRKKMHSLKQISGWRQNGTLWESSYILIWIKREALYSSEIVIYRTNEEFFYEGELDLSKSEFDELLEKFGFHLEQANQHKNQDLSS